ncbi:hypothetical protein QTP86_017453, partial [Hemibagrus guttatus]
FFKANFTFAVFPGLKVLKQCMELNVTRPDPSVPPVDVAVYYDSLCPGWRTFLTGQLFPTWTMLRDIMRLILVPYGNAKKLPDQKVFSCQHGKPEWQANMLEACILNVTGHSAFLIVHCVESSSDVINAAQPVYTPEWEDKAMSSLFNLVCKLYRGIKPPTCTGSLKKLDQGFCNSFS